MKPHVKVDTSEFNAALRESVFVSRKSLALVVNSKALHLAKRALAETKRADSNKIARTLGQVATKLTKDRKTGRLKRGKRVFGGVDTFAAAIIRTRRANAKPKRKKPLTDKEMVVAVKKMINARIRSVGFIASGWKWSIMDMGRKVTPDKFAKPVKSRGKLTPKGKRMGWASAARSTESKPSANIVNTALNPDKSPGKPMPIAEAGLRKALAIEVADIRDHVQKRLRADLKKFSVRKF